MGKHSTAIARMMQNAKRQDRGIFVNCAVYTVISLGIPLISVALPRVLLGMLTGPEPSMKALVTITAAFLAAGGCVYFFKTWIHDRCYPRITTLRIDCLRDQVVKIISMDYRYIEDAAFEEKYDMALSACNGNVGGLEGIYHKLYELPALAVNVIALAVFVGWRSLPVLAAILLHIGVTVFVTIRVQKYQYSRKEDLSHCQRRLREYSRTAQDFASGKDIRVYDLKERVMDNYRLDLSGYIRVKEAIARREFALGFASLATLLISDVATYGILTWLTVRGMSIADYSMYVVAAVTLTAQMTEFSENITFIMNEYLYVKDYYEFMDMDLGEKGGDVPAVAGGTALDIEFSHVTFRYPGTEKNVFTDFSLRIPAGQRLAVVGVNGAGKSTLIKLLTGLYPVESGEIRVNGVRVQDYDRKALYSMFAAVFQETNVLAFTVAENIAGTSENIDEAKVLQVLDKVGMGDKVRSLPKGIHQMMLKVIEEDGAQFSGGENQKLSIARALYKGGSCVIMDEPTAALDALAEAEIYREFDELTEGKTAIYISHRLASTKFCDCIALLDGDGLKEYGTHSELMAKKGEYYRMFMTQSKYYREGASA